MNGVVCIDKPRGPTSFEMVRRARRALSVRRIGHAGTLDPMATGVLLLCVGEATKLVPYLQDADKVYEATVLLGVTTDTDDADEGSRVIARAEPAQLQRLSADAVREAAAGFVGTIRQRPPRYSALKVEGARLYDLARGAAVDDPEIERHLSDKERPVRIDGIDVIEAALPEVRLTVRCGKGTYIRALARDLGERLGVGGHLVSLRRLRVGHFSVEQACSLDTPVLCSMEDSLSHLPAIRLDEEEAARLRSGQRSVFGRLAPRLPKATDVAADVAVALDEAGRLCAVLCKVEGGWTIGRGFAR